MTVCSLCLHSLPNSNESVAHWQRLPPLCSSHLAHRTTWVKHSAHLPAARWAQAPLSCATPCGRNANLLQRRSKQVCLASKFHRLHVRHQTAVAASLLSALALAAYIPCVLCFSMADAQQGTLRKVN